MYDLEYVAQEWEVEEIRPMVEYIGAEEWTRFRSGGSLAVNDHFRSGRLPFFFLSPLLVCFSSPNTYTQLDFLVHWSSEDGSTYHLHRNGAINMGHTHLLKSVKN